MSIYLARTLLLALGIAIFVSVCFQVVREDLKIPAIVKLSDPKPTYSVDYNDTTYTVSVRDITDTNSIHDLVSGNGSLSFNELFTISELATPLMGLHREWNKYSFEKTGDSSMGFFSDVFIPSKPLTNQNGEPSYFPQLGFVRKENSNLVLEMLADSAVRRQFPPDVQFALGDVDSKDQLSAKFQLLYALKRNINPLSNKNIVGAEPYFGDDNQSHVSVTFDPAGARRWEKITMQNVGRSIAICINDKVITAPYVMQAFSGVNTHISMPDEEHCRVMSVLLTSGELKIPVRIIQSQVKPEEKVSPKVLTGYMDYIVLFVLAFCISFCVIWFVFKPGKKLSGNV